jgi:hypothetical protein
MSCCASSGNGGRHTIRNISSQADRRFLIVKFHAWRSYRSYCGSLNRSAKVSCALFAGYFTRSHHSILTGSPNGTAR